MAERHVHTNTVPASSRWRTERRVFGIAVVALLLAWSGVVLLDVVGVGAQIGITTEAMTWLVLFGSRGPIEWLQWFYMAAFVGFAGYIVGRLSTSVDPAAEPIQRFCLLMLIGMIFMLIEDAGDLRHVINELVGRWRGVEAHHGLIFGLPQSFLIDAPYMTALAAIPLYALIRHGGSVWRVTPTRPYLVMGFGFYGIVGLGHVVARLSMEEGEFTGVYPQMGRWISSSLFRDTLAFPAYYPDSRLYYELVDSLIEESLELLAAAAMVALLFAIARSSFQHAARPEGKRRLVGSNSETRGGGFLP